MAPSGRGAPSGPELVARAPAKLNLGLWIVRKRPDRYHDLVTIFVAVDRYDRLTVRSRPTGFTLTCDDRRLPTDERNLVIRAARAFAEDTGITAGAAFRLEKGIPAGAGMGGGSSDAAAAIVLLDRLWGTRSAAPRLARIAAAVGSDVPFFLQGGLQLGRGRGTRLTRLTSRTPFEFVVVHGHRPIDTGWAYSRYERELTASAPPPSILALAEDDRLPRSALEHLDNHLEAGLVPVVPDIAERKALLTSLGARVALLTGSGSSVYGLFATRELARRARQRVVRAGWQADLCRSVSSGVVVEGG